MKGGIGLLMAEPEKDELDEYNRGVIKINTHRDSFYFNTQIIKKKGKKKLRISINFQSPKPPSYSQILVTRTMESVKRLAKSVKSEVHTIQTQNQIDNSRVDNLTLDDLNSNIGTVMGRDGGLFNLEATDTTFEFKSKSFNVKLEDYDKKNKSGILTLSTSNQFASWGCYTFKVDFHFEGQEITIFIKITKPITRDYPRPKEKKFTITIINNKIQEIIDDKKNKIIYQVTEFMEVDIFTKEEELRNQQELQAEERAKPIF
jgi:hypothetical protein